MNRDQKHNQISMPLPITDQTALPAKTEQTISRRKLLKTLAAAGGAATITMILPARWFRPVSKASALPVHAQVSSLSTATPTPPPAIYQYELIIPATSSIFGAGHTTPPNTDICAQDGVNGGTLPPHILIPSGARRTLTFDEVTGLIVNFLGGTPYIGPDGVATPSDTDWTNINSAMGISGVKCTGLGGFLVGVFLSDEEPTNPAPPRLDFTGAVNFASITPLLNQTFYIGDGLMGTGSGNAQVFYIPENATRLFLGIADSDWQENPGCYGDNSGSFTASFRIVVP
ncbi:MAG TPA: twin-arginine translocation signal domain-containing protein [Anaerolineae bacterium]|nr:twin-arginine translocation signal domain-containing protein [Anaerolineae bacterium]